MIIRLESENGDRKPFTIFIAKTIGHSIYAEVMKYSVIHVLIGPLGKISN